MITNELEHNCQAVKQKLSIKHFPQHVGWEIDLFHWCHCENQVWKSVLKNPKKKKHQKKQGPCGRLPQLDRFIDHLAQEFKLLSCHFFLSIIGWMVHGLKHTRCEYYCKERAQATFNIHKKTTKNTGRWINKNHVAPRKLPPWPSHPCCQRNDCLKSYRTMEVHGLFVLLALFGNTSGFWSSKIRGLNACPLSILFRQKKSL